MDHAAGPLSVSVNVSGHSVLRAVSDDPKMRPFLSSHFDAVAFACNVIQLDTHAHAHAHGHTAPNAEQQVLLTQHARIPISSNMHNSSHVFTLTRMRIPTCVQIVHTHTHARIGLRPCAVAGYFTSCVG
jgi:hypothetical protein